MSYTGSVRVGGPADVRVVPGLQITKVAVGPYDNNAYLLRCRETGDVLLIDAAADPARLLSLIGDGRLVRIVTTHGHGDHWQALAAVAGTTRAPVVAHPLDADALPVSVTEPVTDGATVSVGTVSLSVIHLSGHTPGGIALLYSGDPERPHLFTGDSLFPGGIGKTTKQTFDRLFRDVTTKVFDRLPDETWVYPGHGADTTLGAERPSLPEWQARRW